MESQQFLVTEKCAMMNMTLNILIEEPVRSKVKLLTAEIVGRILVQQSYISAVNLLFL